MSFWNVIFSYSTQQWTIFLLDCDLRWKVDRIQLLMISSVVGPKSSKALPKLAPKKGHGHYLVLCGQYDPLQLSESWLNYYIWLLLSANRYKAPKTAMPPTSIGQQKGPNSSPGQYPTAYQTTNASKVEWSGLRSFVSCHNLISFQLTTTSSILTTFSREHASTTSRIQKMLFKNSLNPKAQIFMLLE